MCQQNSAFKNRPISSLFWPKRITYSALLNLEVLVLLPIQLDLTYKLEMFFHDFHSLGKKNQNPNIHHLVEWILFSKINPFLASLHLKGLISFWNLEIHLFTNSLSPNPDFFFFNVWISLLLQQFQCPNAGVWIWQLLKEQHIWLPIQWIPPPPTPLRNLYMKRENVVFWGCNF
jgi:hypothetical protein